MDGYDATRAIRNLDAYRDLPIAALTADVIAGVKDKCLEAGMDDFITKPIDPAQLYSTLKKWIVPPAEGEKSMPSTQAKTGKETLIPDIEGLDTMAGLKRINNNRDLYMKLLIKFARNYHDFISRLRSSLEKGQIEESKRMVHTLKGVSGNISANELYKFMYALDGKLKMEEKIDLDAELNGLEEVLTPILKSLGRIHESQEVDKAEPGMVQGEQLDAGQFRKLLEDLIALLRDGDFEATKKTEELEQFPGAGKFAEEIHRIKYLVSEYDFDEAAGTAERIMKSI